MIVVMPTPARAPILPIAPLTEAVEIYSETPEGAAPSIRRVIESDITGTGRGEEISHTNEGSATHWLNRRVDYWCDAGEILGYNVERFLNAACTGDIFGDTGRNDGLYFIGEFVDIFETTDTEGPEDILDIGETLCDTQFFRGVTVSWNIQQVIHKSWVKQFKSLLVQADYLPHSGISLLHDLCDCAVIAGRNPELRELGSTSCSDVPHNGCQRVITAWRSGTCALQPSVNGTDDWLVLWGRIERDKCSRIQTISFWRGCNANQGWLAPRWNPAVTNARAVGYFFPRTGIVVLTIAQQRGLHQRPRQLRWKYGKAWIRVSDRISRYIEWWDRSYANLSDWYSL